MSERPLPANFDEAVIDSQLARRGREWSGVKAPQYGRPVPPYDAQPQPRDKPKEVA